MNNTTNTKGFEYYLDDDTAVILKNNQAYMITVRPEFELPENCMDIQEDIDYIYNELSSGNHWAWCIVELKKLGTDESDYLGGCSHKSCEDFILNSDYLQDMISRLENA